MTPRNHPRARARTTAKWAALGLLGLVLATLVALATWTTTRYGAGELRPNSLARCELPLVTAPGDARVECYRSVLTGRMRDDAIGAVRYSERFFQRSRGGFAGSCHLVMHDMGRTFGRDAPMGELVQVPYGRCSEGFLHGYLSSEITRGDADQGEVVSLLRTCADRARVIEGVFGCFHGGGHGWMRGLDNDLPAAIDLCRSLEEGLAVRSCASGVYMENVLAADGSDGAKATRFLPADDPALACRGAADIVVGPCYAWMVKEVPAKEGLAWCDDAPARAQRHCLLGLGSELAFDREPQCGAAADCWEGVGFTLANFQAKHAFDGCAGAVRGGAEGDPQVPLEACARGAGRAIAVQLEVDAAADADELCKRAPQALAAACGRGVAERMEPVDFV